MKMDYLAIQEIKKNYEKKIFSVEEFVKYLFQKIKKINPQYNIYLELNEEECLRKAKEADKIYQKGENHNFHLLGIPVAVKDNFCTQGLRTTASSLILENYVPQYDATVVSKLKKSGALIIGKTNLDSFAHGSSTETSDFGPTLNPWNKNHLPGGSSGGSAAAVASDLCTISLGSETAGSIRQPAAWCGIVGLKPTYGRISRYGLIAMQSSADTPGPMAKNVFDCACLLNILSGYDPHDATSAFIEPADFLNSFKKNKKFTIGLPKEYFPPQISQEVYLKIKEAVKTLEKLGHQIKEISLLDPKYAIAVYTILQRSEVSSNLARFDGIRYGRGREYFNEEGKRRIMLGTYSLSAGYYKAYYLKAQKIRNLIIADFKEAFRKVDLILGPTSPTTALPRGSTKESFMFGELQDVLLEPSSLAGLCGINVPCGFDKKGLPIGMQIIGPWFEEEKILNLAFQYEKTTEWNKIKPKIEF